MMKIIAIIILLATTVPNLTNGECLGCGTNCMEDYSSVQKTTHFYILDVCKVKVTTVVNGSSSYWVEGTRKQGREISLINSMPASDGQRRMFDVRDGGNLTLKNLNFEGGTVLVKPLDSIDKFYEFGAIVRIVSQTKDTFFQAIHCTFQKGTAYSGGGAIFGSGKRTKLYLEAVTLKENQATDKWGRGGAILVDDSASLELHQYPTSGASLIYQGGYSSTIPEIWNQKRYISDNQAPHIGGAIAASGGATAKIYGAPHIGFDDVRVSPLKNDRLVIKNNNAGYMGGAFGAETGGSILVRGAEIKLNKAGYFGGAFGGHTSTLRAEHCNIYENSVTSTTYGLGGGVFMDVNTKFVNVNSNYVKDYETAGQPNFALRTGRVEKKNDVARAAEAIGYDLLNMKRNPYGKNVNPTDPTNPNCVLLEITLDKGEPVQTRVPLPTKGCSDDPGICGRNGYVGPCVTNETYATYSSDCRCPLGTIYNKANGCLLCPPDTYNDVLGATSCKPCAIWAPTPGFAKCSPPEEIGAGFHQYSKLSIIWTVVLALVTAVIHIEF